MPRYYDKAYRNEAFEPGENIVELSEDNVFWQLMPEGKRLTFDADDLPNGTEDIPPPAVGTDAAILMSLLSNNITDARITMALMRAHNGNSSSIAAINNTLAVMADNHNTTVEYIMSLME